MTDTTETYDENYDEYDEFDDADDRGLSGFSVLIIGLVMIGAFISVIWIAYQQGIKAHTARCEIRYRQPARVGDTLLLSGWTEKQKGRFVLLKGEARRKQDDALVADCEARFMIEG